MMNCLCVPFAHDVRQMVIINVDDQKLATWSFWSADNAQQRTGKSFLLFANSVGLKYRGY